MCYHTALIADPVQLGRRFGRSVDRIGDFRPLYHPCGISRRYGRRTDRPLPLGTDPFLDPRSRRCAGDPQPHDQRPCGNGFRQTLLPRTDPPQTLSRSGIGLFRLAARSGPENPVLHHRPRPSHFRIRGDLRLLARRNDGRNGGDLLHPHGSGRRADAPHSQLPLQDAADPA